MRPRSPPRGRPRGGHLPLIGIHFMPPPRVPAPVDLEARVALVREVGEEIVTEEELRALLAAKQHPIAYDGFEPSGTAHIAQGVMRAINVNKMTQAGVRFKMFVADWHAWANNKMGGDLERIQTTGKYLIEVWRATGMDLSKVDFIWASEFIEDEAYWKKVMNIARDTSMDRVLRTTQIMGRSEKDKLSAAQILYPCMQAADIFHLQADITQLGMDQRKVNMLAREVGPKLGFWKPVVVSHHMLMGLTQPPADSVRVRKQLEESRILEVRTTLLEIPSQRPGKTILGELKEDLPEIWAELGSAPVPEEPPTERVLAKSMGDDIQWVLGLDERLASAAHSNEASSFVAEAARRCQRLVNASSQIGSERGDFLAKHLAGIRAFSAYLAQAAERLNRVGYELEQQTIERATAMKMSKSNPDSAIFMTDTPEQVQAKIRKAYCPPKQEAENPILEYYRHIVFEKFPTVRIERPAKFGGDVEFASYGDLRDAYVAGTLGPVDAKAGAAVHINRLLDPVREHFAKNAAARELKAQVDGFKVTR